MFGDVRKAAWWLMPLFLIVDLVIRVWQTSWTWTDRAAAWAGQASGGLIGWNLVARLDDYLLIGVLLLGVGRLRPRDLGWRRENLRAGLITLVGVWLLLQGVIAVLALATGSGLTWNPNWTMFPVLVVIGWLIGHLLGTAVVEDTIYRGFLIPQLYLWLGERKRRLGTAVLLSQLLFTLSHIPQWIEYGMDTPLLPVIVLALGLVFSAIFLLTNNLFIVMAFHALHDAPTPLFASPVDPHLLMLLLELAFIGWLWYRRVSVTNRPGGVF